MRIEDIDRNFNEERINASGLIYRSCFDDPFQICGLYTSDQDNVFCRMDRHDTLVAGLSKNIHDLMYHTSGGRIRFQTNSNIVSIRTTLFEPSSLPHMSPVAVMGMDMYAKLSNIPGESEFVTSCVPKLIDNTFYESSFQFANYDNCMREITLYLPLYSKVKSIEIGLDDSAVVAKPVAYATELPVVFYGSSITQGACSSRPGNSYPAILSRLLDCDFLNMSFSGNAHGEAALAEYISKIPMSAFVLDYDYNAQSEKELEDTHFNFYRIIRDTNPSLPIIMMSAPVPLPATLKVGEKRMDMSRIVVMESYIRAKRTGDNNVYFIDGESLLGDICAKDALLDRVHPTDLGFRNMANRIYPILRFVLYGV